MPGTYKVSLSKFEDGKITEIVPAISFVTKSLNAEAIPVEDKKQLDAFCKKVSELRRATSAADGYRGELINKIKFIKTAIIDAPDKLQGLTPQVNEIEKKLETINIKLNGDASLARRDR